MKKYITKAFLATMILAGVASCQKEEDRVFDKPVAERLSEQEQKLQDLLLSSEYGWKLVYNTSEGDFGSFTYLMRFKDARNVEMVSDFSLSGAVSETTEYAIQQRATTSLVFTTRAKIHELSDPVNSPYTSGKGFFGEYQFGYYGNTENTIDFRTPKQDQKVTFVKATKDEWDMFKQQCDMVEKMASVLKPYFRNLEIKVGGDVKRYDLFYSSSVRLAEIVGGEDLNASSGFGTTFDPKGITINPGIKVGNEIVTRFLYNPVNANFEYNGNGNSASISYSEKPAVQTKDYKKLLATPDVLKDRSFQFAGDDSTIYSKRNSMLFMNTLEKLGKDADGKYNLSLIQLKFKASDLNGLNYILYVYKEEQYIYAFATQDGGDALKIVELMWLDAATVPAELKELNRKLMQDKLYVKVENFRLGYSNPVVTFIGNKESMAFSTWDVGKPLTF